MRTFFKEFDPDHLEIHADLGTEYNRTRAVDFSKLAKAVSLDARDFGLADGATSDGQAFADAFLAVSALRTWGDRSVAGVKLVLPPGEFVPTVQHGNPAAARVPLLIESPAGNGGFCVIEGSTAGGTTIRSPDAGCGLGHFVTTGACTRSGNLFTVPATAHGLIAGSPIVFNLTSRANTKNFVTAIVQTVPNANTFTYVMGDPTAANLDLLKIATGARVDRMDYLLEPTGFRQDEYLIFRNIAFIGPPVDQTNLGNAAIHDPNNLPSPQLAYAIRKTSRVWITDCLFEGWWAAECLNGAARGPQGKQNTDHNGSIRCQYQGNVDHSLFLANQRFPGGPDIGGSRDHWWRDCQYGVAARSMRAIADTGSHTSGTCDLGHDKSIPFPVFIEGVEGVLPNNQPKLTLLGGQEKHESPGNCATVWDESRKSTWDQTTVGLRSEVSIAINGGPGNLNTATLTPWACTTSVTGGVQTTTGLPAGHALRKNDHVCTGSGLTVGGSYVAGIADGAGIVKTVSGGTITMDRPDLTRTGTGGTITGTTTLTMPDPGVDANGAPKPGPFYTTDTGSPITGTGIPGGTTVTFVSATVVTLSAASTNGAGVAWTIVPTYASYSAYSGLIAGMRIGLLDGVTLHWQVGLSSGGNQLARSAFWFDFDQQPKACTIHYVSDTGSGGGNTAADLPSISVAAPVTPYASRTVLWRGGNKFLLRFHDAADTNPIPVGGLTDIRTTTAAFLSGAVKTQQYAGVAMQASPALGADATVTNGSTGNAAVATAQRQWFWSAGSDVQLSDDAPSLAKITAAPPTGLSATIHAGDPVGDAGDGGVGAWNGTQAGLRIVGQAVKNGSGGLVAIETCAQWWTP